jgi:hypothetical protein
LIKTYKRTLGWIRLQNGYYLPIYSTDGKVSFLTKVSTRAENTDTDTTNRMGSCTPLFRGGENDDLTSSLLNGNVAIATPTKVESSVEQKMMINAGPTKKDEETVRAAVHMDAMAFGMGCCCLQITFQAMDVEESRFIYDQLAVMAPM